MAAWNVDRAGKVRLVELVLLAHVQDHDAVRARHELVDLLRVHLPDLLLRLANEVAAAWHPQKLLKPGRNYFKKYSVGLPPQE